LAAGITGGVFIARLFPGLVPKVKPKVITVTEPAKMIYISVPSPVPVPIEKIIYREGKISFTQDVPFDNTISTTSVDIQFSGTHHVTMENNLLSIIDEINGEAKVTMRISEKPLSFNEMGPFFSTASGSGIYYRRYFDQVLIFCPWAEIRTPFTDVKNTEITIGFPVKF
jgi:hypothetical protein